ncbi:hypothetical protein PBY51_021060 [Eleginops maclovinus]|uniref:Sushi domain-containing protein n=1 Tax=Eleginops maclovinus TaxID=56733 RepID=A0AAN7XEQ8_ELEMC|nr:hypothetical protein PBY51_021060 [Eleginops maclovinus]
MWARYLGVFLLVWNPQVLHAQSATQPCPAPSLNGGFFPPRQLAYNHEATLSYACHDGRKPAVKGWWGTSRCKDGNWSPKPQCIDEKACTPPDLPNASYMENQSGWHEDAQTIRITCDEGYESKNRDTTAQCVNGKWSSVPVCQKITQSCGEPPKIPHAVIINREYQELFEADSKVQYECEDGYTGEGSDIKTVICISGNWTEGPTCNRRPDTGHDGYTERGTGGGQPTGGVTNCGTYPSVLNGDVVVVSGGYLKYQCSAFYKLEGPDTVMCQSNGKWTEPPSCRDAFCVLDPAQITIPNMILSTIKYVKEGEDEFIPCIWNHFFIRVQCVNREFIIPTVVIALIISGKNARKAQQRTHCWTENRSRVGSIFQLK